MNKIEVVNSKVVSSNIDDSIILNIRKRDILFDVDGINIEVVKNTDLIINYDILEESKLDINIHVQDGIKFNLYEFREGVKLKVKYRYHLDEESKTIINRFSNAIGARGFDIVNLDGENATIDFVFKTISVNSEKYDMVINHNANKTNSNIINHGFNKDQGSLIFNVTSLVPNTMVDCYVNQSNRIVTNNELECKISPNLLIEENDVIANHSAFIGGFKSDEIFYMMSRGISEEDAVKLLTKGFMLSELSFSDELKERIDYIINQI